MNRPVGVGRKGVGEKGSIGRIPFVSTKFPFVPLFLESTSYCDFGIPCFLKYQKHVRLYNYFVFPALFSICFPVPNELMAMSAMSPCSLKPLHGIKSLEDE